jgi:hypothetical protein
MGGSFRAQGGDEGASLLARIERYRHDDLLFLRRADLARNIQSRSTLIRHFLSLPVHPLPIGVIPPPFEACLVTAVCRSTMFFLPIASTQKLAVGLAAVTEATEVKNPTTVTTTDLAKPARLGRLMGGDMGKGWHEETLLRYFDPSRENLKKGKSECPGKNENRIEWSVKKNKKSRQKKSSKP